MEHGDQLGLIGQQVGPYQLVSTLGEGGMGVVYKGVDTRYGQEVALKALHPALMADDELRERFVREAQALARLNHPNVVRLLDFIDRGDTCFIVMEFVRGETIEQIMSVRGLIPPLEAADMFVQVLAAAHYAHGLGIIHRDIKPANIAVLESGQVKLLDFGTAKVVDAQRLTRANMTLGTLVYMSPEQVCGRDLDHRSDIYSLGVTLYEMVTGYLPHDSEDEKQLFREIVRGRPDPPSRHYPHVPNELERIILRAIEKDPARRFQTAEEFLQALRAFSDRNRNRAPHTPPSGVYVRSELAHGADAAGSGDEARTLALAIRRRCLFWSGVAVGLCSVGALGAAFGVEGYVGGLFALAGLGVYVGGVLIGARVPSAALGGRADSGGERKDEQNADDGQGASLLVAPPDSNEPPPPAPDAQEAVRIDQGRPAPFADGWAQPTAQADAPASGPGTEVAGTTALLYVFEGPDQGKSWVLPHGAVTIGRGKHNTIVLHDAGVSTSHAQIGFDGERFVITDLESRNGTYVNGCRVHSFALGDRDVIAIGQSRLAIAFQ